MTTEESKPGEPVNESPLGRVRQISAGEVICFQGDLGTEMYVIQEGEVEVWREADGKEQRLAVLGKGDFFGEMSLLEDLPRTATVHARTPVRLVEIDGATFNSMLRSNTEIAVRIMRKLSRRIRELDQSMDSRGKGKAKKAVEPKKAPDKKKVALESWVLLHPGSGSHFQFAPDPEIIVGRLDPVTGIRPDVDLSSVDGQRSSSRLHAKIRRQGEGLFLVEDIGTTNGTFVNGSRLQKGVPVEIRPGDRVRFGLVEMTFTRA